ncbi:MAG TPA: lipopolysaccharide biosynthesis protein RfbH [Gammaproteobacteria bacterium]|nr:lipopolysaccharide biosynthesis protein RfbH [Gammaproteobacteria bacterium]
MPVDTQIGEVWIYKVPFVDSKGAKPRPVVITSTPNHEGDVMGVPGTSKLDQGCNAYQQVISSSDLLDGKLVCPILFSVSKQMVFSPRFFAAKVGRIGRESLDALLRKVLAFQVENFDKGVRSPKKFIPGKSHVPVSGKVIGVPEIQNMVDASLDAWLTTGRFNDAFEKRLAEFLGIRYALTTNSGSSANLLAVSALTSPKLGKRALKPGDEVITVAAGFPTTVNPIIQNGLIPVFVDVDIPTYNIDPEKIEAAVTEKTRAIMIAHTLGNPFNLDAVLAVVKKHDLWLIEDCCDALGSTYALQDPSLLPAKATRKTSQSSVPGSRHVGTFGHIGTLSFYPAHHITMGEGGAVFTKDSRLKVILESFRDWGRDCYCDPGKDNTCKKRFDWQLGSLPKGYDHKYTYSHLGYNLKISDIQAAVGLAQMDRLEGFIEARKKNFIHIKGALSSLEEFFILPEATPNSDPAWFGFPITIREDAPFCRVDLLRYMSDKKIGTRLLFAGNLIRQPYFEGINYRIEGELNNTDRIMNQTFWVGTYPGLNGEILDYTSECIKSFLS